MKYCWRRFTAARMSYVVAYGQLRLRRAYATPFAVRAAIAISLTPGIYARFHRPLASRATSLPAFALPHAPLSAERRPVWIPLAILLVRARQGAVKFIIVMSIYFLVHIAFAALAFLAQQEHSDLKGLLLDMI